MNHNEKVLHNWERKRSIVMLAGLIINQCTNDRRLIQSTMGIKRPAEFEDSITNHIRILDTNTTANYIIENYYDEALTLARGVLDKLE